MGARTGKSISSSNNLPLRGCGQRLYSGAPSLPTVRYNISEIPFDYDFTPLIRPPPFLMVIGYFMVLWIRLITYESSLCESLPTKDPCKLPLSAGRLMDLNGVAYGGVLNVYSEQKKFPLLTVFVAPNRVTALKVLS